MSASALDRPLRSPAVSRTVLTPVRNVPSILRMAPLPILLPKSLILLDTVLRSNLPSPPSSLMSRPSLSTSPSPRLVLSRSPRLVSIRLRPDRPTNLL